MSKYRVKELAQARGLTQEQLAIRTEGKVALSTIQRMWQNRGVKPRPDTLAAVADVLGVEPSELIEEDGQPVPRDVTLLSNQRALVPA